ncbi:MAG: esterase family protein, partial [Bacteroidaceae bacterium]|nr:esterase family protein [Bacteroidaceae bacterium]
MKKLIILALICLTAISGYAQRHGGKVIEDSLNSDILGRNKKFCVYLPKSYDKETERNYPVLYLLHGLTNNYKTWRDLGNIGPIANQIINAGSANEMIIIMPDAGTDYDGYFNCGDKWRYEDFFFQEFMPQV